MSGSFRKPTESEMEILQILWKEGDASVRHVNQILIQKREVGYTTTLKLMQIMLEKGLVKRNTDARSHIYSAAVSEDLVKEQMLDRFLNKTFRGSASALVMQVLGNHSASPEELEEIKALIQKLEKSK